MSEKGTENGIHNSNTNLSTALKRVLAAESHEKQINRVLLDQIDELHSSCGAHLRRIAKVLDDGADDASNEQLFASYQGAGNLRSLAGTLDGIVRNTGDHLHA